MIQLVLENRADVAVVSHVYLQQFLHDNPGLEQQLLISERYDQVYQHHVLLAAERADMAPQIMNWLSDVVAADLLPKGAL